MARSDPYAFLPVGTVLGDSYRLVRKIAEGGMGAVYEARALRLDRRCAVKVMSRELAASSEALARFHREAHVSSQLAHPHIVQVTDFGTAESGEPYMVMEYLEGEDLARRLRRMGRLAPVAVAQIVKQAGSALAATHARGIVHRDLKPANIFLLRLDDEGDFVKVVDFGISKIKGTALRLTRASVLMGTPGYMAPEQAMGRVDSIDPRTDQWALACIAWEMLTGSVPFDGGDLTELLYHVVHDDPVLPSGRTGQLPPGVEEILRRGLAKKQRQRYGSVTEFARALGEAIDAYAAEAQRTGRRHNAATGETRLLRLVSYGKTLFTRAAAAAAPTPTQALPAFTWIARLSPQSVWQTLRLRWPRRRRLVGVALGATVLAALVLWGGGVPWWKSEAPPLSTPRALSPGGPAVERGAGKNDQGQRAGEPERIRRRPRPARPEP